MKFRPFLNHKRSGKIHLLFLLTAAVLLSACAVRQEGSWPSVSSKDSTLYVAYGPDVIALDVESQEELWRYSGEGAVEFYAPPTPSDSDDILYLADFGRSGGLLSGGRLIVSLYALNDVQSGVPDPVWLRDDQINGRVVAGFANDGDTLFTGTSNNQIIAVDQESGDLQWTFDTENAIWSAPAILDDVIYASSIDRNIYAVDKNDGSVVWTHTLNGAGAGSPVVSADQERVYAGSFGQDFSGELIALNATDGSDIWQAKAADWVWAAPAEVDGLLVYGDIDGNVYAVDAMSGEQQWEVQVNGSIVGDIVIADSTIIVPSGDETTLEGFVTAFSLSGEQVWETEVGSHLQSSPAVLTGGKVAVVYADAENSIPLGVEVLNAENGSKDWTWTLSEE
ncbi:MAG: PQQ-binding-like beta-propeller repeat protein [Chloroflexota bacterium]